MEQKDTASEIIEVIDRIRPFIQRDGGDLKFVRFEDGIVYVKLFGACVGCSAIDETLSEGIEAILRDEIPEVVKVVQVMDVDDFGTEVTEDDIENN